MLLKIGICDDEPEYTTILADYLKTYDIDSEKDYSFQIDKFTSAKELLSAYTKPETYHILFLDVEMPEITGIELAKKIRMLGDKNVRIVFVSHYPEYMQDSFDVQAFYYLSKPLNYNDFCIIIKKLIKSIGDSVIHKIIIPTNTHQKIIVNTDDIIYIEAIKTEKNALHFILKNDDVYCNGTINEWENKLGKTHFLTPYRGTLVNLNHIHIVEKTSLIMTNGDTLPLSRHYQKQVRSFFAKKTLNIFN